MFKDKTKVENQAVQNQQVELLQNTTVDGVILNRYFDDLDANDFSNQFIEAVNRNGLPLSDGEINDTDSDHEAIKSSIKKEIIINNEEPAENNHSIDHESNKRKRHEHDDDQGNHYQCNDNGCKESGSCNCQSKSKKEKKKKKHKLIQAADSELPLPIVIKTDSEALTTADSSKIRIRSNLTENSNETEIDSTLASSLTDTYLNDQIKFRSDIINLNEHNLTSFAPNLPIKTKQMVKNQCLECVNELTILEMEPIQLKFIYTRTATVSEKNINLFKMQSPLNQINNCYFNFSSIRNNINPEEFGISILPNVVKKVASGIGCSIERIEAAIKTNKGSKMIETEAVIKPISFYIDSGVQTDPISCIDCLKRKAQKPLMFSENTKATQTVDSPYSNLPIMELIPKMSPAAQLALNDFAEMLQSPATGSGDMYKIRDRLLDIYTRGSSSNMLSSGTNVIYPGSYTQLPQVQPIYPYPLNNGIVYTQPINNAQIFQHPIQQYPITQYPIQQQSFPPQPVHRVTNNDPRINRRTNK